MTETNATLSPEQVSKIVSHPDHYNWHPRVECVQVAQEFGFNLGSAIKYIWRAGRKDSNSAEQDLRKAIQFLQFEIERNSRS